jgi:hypothetical protein
MPSKGFREAAADTGDHAITPRSHHSHSPS